MPRDQATARLHREWLKALPGLTGKKLTTIAREIRVSPSTLTRPLSEGNNGTSTLHANTIAKIIAATGAPPPQSEIEGPPRRGHAGALRTATGDVTPFVPSTDDPVSAAVETLVAGANSIAAYTVRSRALELAGFLPGDVVLVDLANTHPRPGEAVCAIVREWSGARPATIIRIFEHAPPINLLVAHTAGAQLAPIVVDNVRVTILGVLLPHRLHPADVSHETESTA
jgi:hypothetical protein